MFYFVPTKHGRGAQLWGAYDDLLALYEIIGKFWDKDGFTEKQGFETRDQVISGFVHEIRKAYEGSRLTREHSHFMLDPIPHFGCNLSWIHLIFALNAIRFNMRFFESNNLDLGMMLQAEHWVEESLKSYDQDGAASIIPYLYGGVEQGNRYLYQYMRSINSDYFDLKAGKTSFRMLGKLLKKAVYATEEYNQYLAFLILEAKRSNCEVEDLDINDDNKKYDEGKW